jgi:hypothetical protein
MRIILSRKGFDGRTGGFPSPIMPCGRLLSLPIPVTANGEYGIPYADLKFDGQPLTEVINQLSNGRFNYPQAHLDPDLDRDRYTRKNSWRPVFGQIGKAQSHLANQGVGKGDLFLFYGWFNEDGHDRHVIFGWLHIGDCCEVKACQHQDEFPLWLHYHPHIVNRALGNYTNNNIYIAADRLILEGLSVPGAGTFPCFKRSLQLTDPKEIRRRYWRLPSWFYPFGQPSRRPLSYHCNRNNWTTNNDHVILKSACPGQEFVLDTEDYPEAIEWLKGLFEDFC